MQPDAKPADAALIKPASGQTVIVLPVAGPEDLLVGDALAEATARSLRQRDIPASVRGGDSNIGQMLTGYAELSGAGASGRLRVRWELVDAAGKSIGIYRQEQTVSPRRWAAGDPELLRSIADNAAPALVAVARGEPAPGPPPAAPTARVMRVHLLPVSGAPGDGNASLYAAMAAQLRRDRIPMTASREDADIMLRGAVFLSAADAGQQHVRIVWSALDKREDGLGEIRQANRVPAGSLGGAWGQVARLVARAAAGGLLDLMRRNGVGSNAAASGGKRPASRGAGAPVATGPAAPSPAIRYETGQYRIGAPGG